MNILIVSPNYSPEIGAAPSRLANMAQGLQNLGANISVLTALPNYPKGRIFENYRNRIYKKEIINNIETYRYWTYASVSKKTLPRVLSMFAISFTFWLFAFKVRKIRNLDLVIIQTPTLPAAYSATIIFKFLYKKNIALNVSDLWPLTGVELGAMKVNSNSYNVMLMMERFIYKHSNIILGQSNEIIDYIKLIQPSKRFFLYRNLQPHMSYRVNDNISRISSIKIVYAGLLGVAQNILNLIKQVNFNELNAELHLYGGGNQTTEIEKYISKNKINVFYHGYVEKKDMANVLSQYHASIVPLTTKIRGAVPSKIFDLIAVGIPIIFCGGGEGANIINQYNIGYISEPGDFNKLSENIKKLRDLSDEDYTTLKYRCISVSKSDFSFEKQIEKLYKSL